MRLRHRILNILFWSVVSAAFIGPGTVTTAAKTGALFDMNLLWVLLLSTLACILLQEAASRITILSGRNIGEIIAEKKGTGKGGLLLVALIILAICGGAAAYEMGNLIGAREGILLLYPRMGKVITLLIGAAAAVILFIPSLKFISRFMGVLVMVLGILFLYTAIRIAPPFSEMFKGLFVPSMPADPQAPWLALALVGTTIVPYNLFLGSGISKGFQKISEMRWGLVMAILLGGIFSLAVVIVGSAISEDFSFQALSEALSLHSGIDGHLILGTGLFAAGFTSAITAPLASAITLKSLFGRKNPGKWGYNGLYFRFSWLGVLLIGMVFALLNIHPVPAIIFAQALNGIILPLVSFLLVYFVHDLNLTGRENHPLNTILLDLTLVLTVIIGLNNLVTAVSGMVDHSIDRPRLAFMLYAFAAVLLTGLFNLCMFRKKKRTD